MTVVSLKVPDKMKEEMERVKDRVDWPEEIRGFIEGRLQETKRAESIRNAEAKLTLLRRYGRGQASSSVRRDRDSHD